MTKIEIVKTMVENGYHLFNETEEQFAEKFDEATLKRFLESFLKWKKERA